MHPDPSAGATRKVNSAALQASSLARAMWAKPASRLKSARASIAPNSRRSAHRTLLLVPVADCGGGPAGSTIGDSLIRPGAQVGSEELGRSVAACSSGHPGYRGRPGQRPACMGDWHHCIRSQKCSLLLHEEAKGANTCLCGQASHAPANWHAGGTLACTNVFSSKTCNRITRPTLAGVAQDSSIEASEGRQFAGLPSAPRGFRTPVLALRGPRPGPLDDGGPQLPNATTERARTSTAGVCPGARPSPTQPEPPHAAGPPARIRPGARSRPTRQAAATARSPDRS
jgi:hypothetical protein